MKRYPAFAIVLAAFLAACGGGDDNGGTPKGGSTTKTYTASELATIVLQTSEAPSGTQFVAQISGPQSVENFSEDAEEKAKLTEAGFSAAHTAVFLTPGFLESAQAPPNAQFVAAFALIVRDAASARALVDFEKGRDAADAEGEKEISVAGLGEGGYAFSVTKFEAEAPYPGFLFVWTRGHAIFGLASVGLEGTVTEAAARARAEKMDGRAA